ncbi:hypothetical protein GLW07_02685 [Bacillus hwajinpoensis]|uniref:Uncharacterized protein n=1 Tax=Guptibacillus hwajinpoensis TaxID=208199 RepID=A0A845EU95_9BACL|nr:hypothetical protein [Pseudalkalibacillus hwajinpoensis]MYL62256.1 hypothetical protein [Pseudalkalibacillus hwajinpoensis]
MIEQNHLNEMWKELQDFVKRVEKESSAQKESAKPYIDQIKSILMRELCPEDK